MCSSDLRGDGTGRHMRLKISGSKDRAGSTPARGSKQRQYSMIRFRRESFEQKFFINYSSTGTSII